MKPTGGLIRAAAVAVLAVVPVLSLVPQAGAAVHAAAAGSGLCRSPTHHRLAARVGRDIDSARHGRVSAIAVRVDDPSKGLQCWLHGARPFDSASVVKVTILGALLRKALVQHRYLTDTEAAEATAMITRSDNGSASALWDELGRGYIHRFLNLAGMRQTVLGVDGFWGLTQITAHDQVLLLRLLLHRNPVLDPASRRYALRLMSQVIGSQRWGVPAGAPASLTVHVKNGWLPSTTHGWYVHSIGCFTGRHGGYSIVILTDDNPTFSYGVATIDAVARAINRDLNR
jgi:beta-lactamase class A